MIDQLSSFSYFRQDFEGDQGLKAKTVDFLEEIICNNNLLPSEHKVRESKDFFYTLYLIKDMNMSQSALFTFKYCPHLNNAQPPQKGRSCFLFMMSF